MPVSRLRRSTARCVIEPLPEEAYDSLAGLALASLMNSGSVRTPSEGLVARTIGEPAIMAIGSKSFSTSYGSLAYSVALIAWLGTSLATRV